MMRTSAIKSVNSIVKVSKTHEPF